MQKFKLVPRMINSSVPRGGADLFFTVYEIVSEVNVCQTVVQLWHWKVHYSKARKNSSSMILLVSPFAFDLRQRCIIFMSICFSVKSEYGSWPDIPLNFESSGALSVYKKKSRFSHLLIIVCLGRGMRSLCALVLSLIFWLDKSKT